MPQRTVVAGSMILLLLSITAAAQRLPEFDVATVKPELNLPGNYIANLGKTSHGLLTLNNATLADCLKFAYSFSSDLQIAGPPWIFQKDTRFEITGKADPKTPRSDLKLMLQALLNERFQIKMHREPREASYLALVVGKKGPKVTEVDPETSTANAPPNRPGLIDTPGTFMHMLATVLSRFLRQPVIDETGLKGKYALRLEWTPDPEAGALPSAYTSGAPSIYTAVQEQIGLRLDSRKGPIDVLVVDSALKKPLDN